MIVGSARVRALTVAGAVLPLCLMLASTAPAASASATWTGSTPAADAVLSSTTFKVQAAVAAGSAAVTLRLHGVDAQGASLCSSDPKVTSDEGALGGTGSSAQTLTLAIPSSGTCTTTANGQWMATLSGDASGTRSFTTNAAPATPSGFSAEGSGARDVSFTWSRGTEPDLQSYQLYGDGTLLDGSIPCSSSTCSYALYYPSDNPGTHTYQLAVKRASGGCASCGSSLSSGRASSSTTLTAPPKPSPTPTPSESPSSGGTTGDGSTGAGTTGSGTGGTTGSSSSGSTGGSTGGSAGSGTTGGGTTGSGTSSGGAVNPGPKPTLPSFADPIVASRRAFALNFSSFSPSLGIPKLPPLPLTTLPRVGEQPLADGTYDPKLPYGKQTQTTEVTTATRSLSSVQRVLDSAQLARSIAAALIFLLAAAHLRRFLGSHTD